MASTNHDQSRQDKPTAIIVGGGVIGCSAALELTKAGFACTLVEKAELNGEASIAAAGMLGAQVETHHPGPFYDLCCKSQQLYRSWAEELADISGISTQYVAHGILRVSLTEEDEAELRSRLPWIQHTVWMEPKQLRELEPELTASVRGGLYMESDHQVQPTALAQALKAALIKLGCRIREWTPVFRLIEQQGVVTGIQTSDGPLYADRIVLAAGAWSSALTEPLGLSLPMFPVKGQCISVRPTAPLTRSTIFTKGCYIVPKQDGSAIIGASQVEAGFDKRATVETITALHSKASALLPRMLDAEFIRTWVGLRPGTRDGLPFLGTWNEAPGLIFATGHFRNGILLAPVTGLLVKQLALGEPTELDLTAYTPSRALMQNLM